MTSPIDEKKSSHSESQSRPAAVNFSNPSALLSHIFSHSWLLAGTYSIPDLCAYIERTPTGRINLSKWCKDRTGVPHEFLVLQIESPHNKRIWLRLERRPRRRTLFVRMIASPDTSDDTVSRLCINVRIYQTTQLTKYPGDWHR